MSKEIQTNKRIAKNTLFLYFRMILLMGVTLYISRVVLDCLGIVDYGVYNVVGGMVAMFIFMNTALAQASQRYIAFGIGKDNIDMQQKTFSMLLNVHIILALIIFILCETVGIWLLYNKLVIPVDRLNVAFWVMQCSVVTMVVSVTQVPYNAAIYGKEKMDVYAYISIFEALLKLAGVLSLKIFFSDKLLAYGIITMIVSFVIAMTYRLYCIRNFALCDFRRYWSTPLFKELIGYTSWSLIGNMAWTFNSQGMNFLINIFFGPAFNAARGIASSVESAVSSFLYNFTGPSVPPIIKSYAEGNIKEMIRLSIVCSKMGFLLFMCLSIPLICVIDTILGIWLVKVPPLCGVFCVLSLLFVQSNSVSGSMQNMVQATGDVKMYQLTNGLLKLSAMPIVYVLYKLGAPVETYLYVLIILSWVGVVVQLVVVKTKIEGFSIHDFVSKVIFREVLAYIIPLSFALYCLSSHYSLIEAIAVCLIAEMLCLSTSMFFGLNRSERLYVKNLIINKIKKKNV